MSHEIYNISFKLVLFMFRYYRFNPLLLSKYSIQIEYNNITNEL